MFDTYLGTSKDQKEHAPVVIAVPDFAGSQSALPAAMSAALAARASVGPELCHLGARPLVFHVGEDVWVSERAAWAMLVEHEQASAYVSQYIDDCIEGFDGELPSCTEWDVVGQEAVYAYLDRHVRRMVGHARSVSEDIHQVFNAFERFLMACDMDHETHQDDYLEVTIGYLWSDPVRRADFIVLRLLNGQRDGIWHPLAPIIRRRGQLKMVIDRMLQEEDIGWRLHRTVLQLCAVAYGSAERPVDDVLTYCRERVEFDEGWACESRQRSLTSLRRLSDVQPRSSKDTGFHQYSPDTGEWVWSAGP